MFLEQKLARILYNDKLWIPKLPKAFQEASLVFDVERIGMHQGLQVLCNHDTYAIEWMRRGFESSG
jgi:hypothetical protein